MKHIFINKNSDKTFLILHGTGGNESDLVSVAEYINSSYNILGIRGNINENGMNRFFKRFGVGSYDLNSYKEEVTNLNKAIIEFSKVYKIDLTKLTIIGFSNGANIALGLIQHYPNFINSYILLSNDYIDLDKSFDDLSNMNIFISSSKNDPYVDFTNIELLIKRLKEKNASVFLEMTDGHKITYEVLNEIKKTFYN